MPSDPERDEATTTANDDEGAREGGTYLAQIAKIEDARRYRIAGIVVDSSGRPVGGAYVMCDDSEFRWAGFDGVLHRLTSMLDFGPAEVTDADGRFEFKSLWGAQYQVSARKEGCGSAVSLVTAGDISARLVLGSRITPITYIDLRPRGPVRHVRLRVLDHEGRAIVRRTVWIHPLDSQPRTDTAGRVEFRLVERPDRYELSVEADAAAGCPGGSVVVPRSAFDGSEHTLQLRAPVDVIVRVIGPLPQDVELESSGFCTGRAGHDFHLRLPDGECRFTVSAAGFVDEADYAWEPRPGSVRTIELQRHAAIKGRVVLSEGVRLTDVVQRSGSRPRVTVEEDGRFRLDCVSPGDHVFHLQARIRGALEIEAGVLRVSVKAGQVVDIGEIVLPSPVRIAGRVVDVAGEPVGGAQLLAVRRGVGRVGQAVTHADGRFRLWALGSSVRIVAWKPEIGTALSDVWRASDAVTLRLTEEPRVFVRGPDWRRIELETADGFPLPMLWDQPPLFEEPGAKPQHRVPIGPVPPGRVRFRITPSKGAVRTEERIVAPGATFEIDGR